MADSFFGFDTSSSNINDDEGGGGPSEDEYDALNDETFGHDGATEVFDWEMEHEQLAGQLESSRRHHDDLDDMQNSQLEASLSQLVLDETDSPHSRVSHNVWRHDGPFQTTHTPIPPLKNVCTVEEIERQLRQKQQPQQQTYSNQQFFQPRFPVILQRPPGLQGPVPLPFAPQQNMPHSMNQINQMNQPLNKIIGQNQLGQNVNQMGPNLNQMGQNVNQIGQNLNPMGQGMNQMGQMNQLGSVNQFMQNSSQMANQFQSTQLGQGGIMGQLTSMPNHQMGQSNMLQNPMGQNMNHMGSNVNQLGQNHNQIGPNLNQLGPNPNQMGQTMNQMPQNVNHIGQNQKQIGQNLNQIGQGMNQMGQAVNQMGPGVNQMGQGVNQIGPGVNQIGPGVNQIGPGVNQMGQGVNQMIPNGNQFPMNQFPHMMGQPRMIAPPPGMNMPRQNFNPNMGQFNTAFRGPIQQKLEQQQPMNQSNHMNQPMLQIKNQSTPIQNQIHMNQQHSPPKNQTKQIQNNTRMQQTQQQMQQDPKLQKTKIFNNKSMTSQNLVQLIQNTHPMLQYNNSFHNASHHPMLNNRTVFSNQLVSNHGMFAVQRQNGTFTTNNNRPMTNGDDSSLCSEDEYAGLMTQREKQWLVNIQLLQLNQGTPYIHDFYYTVFLERQSRKEKEGVKEAHKANQQNHPFYNDGAKQEGGGRERHNSARHNSCSEESAARAYVPKQFENSLGKLQCGSVTAPRKIIDVDVVADTSSSHHPSRAPSRASTTNPHEAPREMKRTKQLLLDIESLYFILLRLEELNDPLAISNALILKEREEKQRQLEQAQKDAENELEEDSNVFLRNIESVARKPKQDSPKSENIDKRQVVNLVLNQKAAPVKNLLDEDKDDLVNKMFAGLLHTDKLHQILTVRKGRMLVQRFVSRTCASHPRTRALWSRVLRALPHLARRPDVALAPLAAHYTKYIQTTTGWAAILESCSLLAESFDPARTPYALTTAFTLSCVVSLIDKASLLINTPEATSNERQWSKFLKTLARALKKTTLNVAKPTQPMLESKLMYHLKQIDSRTTIEILQRGRPASEFADISKLDVQEQLVKHLCC